MSRHEFQRPDWVCDRFGWWEGEAKAPLHFTIREAVAADFFGLYELFRAGGRHPKKTNVIRWLGQGSYTVYVCCRNIRHVIAACVSKTTPAGTRILFLHVTPDYHPYDIEYKLLRLAAHELPERPTTWTIAADDTERADRLRALGWKMTKADGDETTYTFAHEPLRTVDPGAGHRK
jgi:hypothetical protein